MAIKVTENEINCHNPRNYVLLFSKLQCECRSSNTQPLTRPKLPQMQLRNQHFKRLTELSSATGWTICGTRCLVILRFSVAVITED